MSVGPSGGQGATSYETLAEAQAAVATAVAANDANQAQAQAFLDGLGTEGEINPRPGHAPIL